MPRIVLLLLACLCSSLKAEYRWTGTEWEWVEPERAPLSPALQPAAAAAEGSGDRTAGFSDDDDDYDDEDADPYGGKDAGDDEDDEDDDDYYNNYDQKGKNKKKTDGKGKNNKDSGRLPVAPSPPASKGGKSGSVLPGKAPVPDKMRPDKQNKEVGKGNNKKATTTTAPPPPMSRSKVGGGGGKFIPTDDEDLALEGSGDQDPDQSPYWEGAGGSGDGAPYGGGRNPAVTDVGGAASIDLDSEENTRKTSAAGGAGGVLTSVFV
jgi:hypothetical protein